MLDTILRKYFTNVQSGNDKEACKKPGGLWTTGTLPDNLGFELGVLMKNGLFKKAKKRKSTCMLLKNFNFKKEGIF